VAALPHDRSRLLVEQGIPTELFVNSIDRWIETMIADDRSGEDIVPRIVNAKVIAKEIGVLYLHHSYRLQSLFQSSDQLN
jgi:hypothetical protein